MSYLNLLFLPRILCVFYFVTILILLPLLHLPEVLHDASASTQKAIVDDDDGTAMKLVVQIQVWEILKW